MTLAIVVQTQIYMKVLLKQQLKKQHINWNQKSKLNLNDIWNNKKTLVKVWQSVLKNWEKLQKIKKIKLFQKTVKVNLKVHKDLKKILIQPEIYLKKLKSVADIKMNCKKETIWETIGICNAWKWTWSWLLFRL